MENTTLGLKFACKSCGAYLKYAPGTTHLQCEYCGTENEIVSSSNEIKELDFSSYLSNTSAGAASITACYVKCDTCFATSTIKPNVTSAHCPYCGSPFVLENAYSENVIPPNFMLPFKLDENAAKNEFVKWTSKLWYAPNDLKKVVNKLDYFKGVYIPYWTYDTNTYTEYTGEQGEYYYVTESYTTTENGKSVSKTREVRRTRWYPASGSVHKSFDDLLVTASKSLPEKYIQNLEPWDMENLVTFDQNYLSGFTTEKYQIDLKSGFDVAKILAEPGIRAAIKGDIGGDEQRIHSTSTTYTDIKFKHLLFPLYVSVYKYNDKIYQFLINARTGEVQGQRPYSAIKIFFTIMAVVAIIAAIVYYSEYSKQQ
jgi:LSD1 subclass zinc finger protein